MRRAAWMLAAALPCVATAQLAPFRVVAGGIRALQERSLLGRPEQVSPLTPTANEGLPPKTETLGPPESTDERRLQVLRGGSTVRREGDLIRMSGGSEFLYQGYRITADEVEGNLRTRVFDLRGHVEVLGQDSVVKGDRVVVDFQKRTYQAYDAESQISPSVVKGQVLNDLYVFGRESTGSQREQHALDASLTSCSYESAHFGILAEDLTMRPGKRAIFRRAKIQILGRTIVSLPYLSVPLEDRNYEYLPVVGQSDEEGFFVKNRYGIPLRGDDVFDARLDYMTKLGVGYGGDLTYRGGKGSGTAGFYAVSGRSDTVVLNSRHRQELGFGTFTLDNDFQKNNYMLAAASTMLNTRAVLSLPQRSGSTRLNYVRSDNDSPYSNSQNTQLSMSDNRKFGKDLSTTLDVNWGTFRNSYGTGSQASARSTEQLDLRFRGQQELNWATAGLDYQRSIPVGDTSTFFSGSDRTPVLSLRSDARRLVGGKWAESLPFTTELSLGEFADPSTRSRIGRGFFDLNFQRPDTSQKRFRVETNGQFSQTMYTDDTAQYVLGSNTSLSYGLGKGTAATLRYSYLRPYGYAPMMIDQTGETNQATLDVSFRPARPWLVGAQTGYDILREREGRTAWQQVGLRSEYSPGKWMLFRTLSTYDTFNQVWSNVRLDMTYRPGATLVSLGARYDGFTGTWGNMNLFVDNLKWGRLRFSTILAYNGYNRRFDAQQYSFIYDLHCAEAVLTVSETQTGYRPGRDIQFLVRLKALPFDSLFGRSNRGQPLGVGTGRDF